jgi:glyoxylate reductase
VTGAPHVLVSAALAGDALADLAKAGCTFEVGADPTGLDRASLLARIAGADALIAMLTNRIDEELLARAPRLRVVANHAVGFDNVDVEACRRRGVVVTNTPDVLTDATADLAMALLLAACRRVVESDRLARSGAWRGWSPTELLGVRVTGATLGIVGLGRIGRATARRAQGFGMRILYTQSGRVPADVERELGASFRDLDALFEESDVVSLHCPLTPATRGLVSRERLARMKPGSVLVNTARGACVDEDALADALASGQLAGAGLDVFAAEPRIPERLAREPRAVLTTHIGSADGTTRAQMARLSVDAVLAVLRGDEPRFRVA